jgi:hypothetical protein
VNGLIAIKPGNLVLKVCDFVFQSADLSEHYVAGYDYSQQQSSYKNQNENG